MQEQGRSQKADRIESHRREHADRMLNDEERRSPSWPPEAG